MRKFVGGVSLALLLAVLPGGVSAHPDHAEDDGVLSPLHAGHQHGENDGHLPAVRRNVELVGKLDLFADAEQPGRVADVAVHGDHAYLGAFYEPECRHDSGGVFVVDISDPANPRKAGFIPTTPYAYVGEGVQVLDLDTPSFTGQVLLHNNENCSPVPGGLPAGRGGASLWDVTDPADPRPLAQHVGDTDVATTGGIPHLSSPHQSHSVFGWQQGEKAYMVMVDNAELGNVGDEGFDIDIFDITDPANPVLAVETGLPDFPEIVEDPSPNGNNAFLHDMVVKEVDGRFLLLGSYWDGGYIVLDVTDLPAKPVFLRDTDFGSSEPFAAEMGLPADWTPEGNAHQAEFNHDNSLFLGADEDFNAHRVTGTIAGGTYQGETFSATQGSDTPPITPETPMAGPTQFLGEACGPVLPSTEEGEIALVVRGTCTFTIKVQTAERAGYDGVIVFNDQQGGAGCEAQVNMLAVGEIPSMFVARSVGLKLLDVSP
ncbi:MAG TPA: PA domain-containing protein, partial [Egibacteraceae bacterium]|nr:PA domain-containing protein [Egibacteraceae bacterium]